MLILISVFILLLLAMVLDYKLQSKRVKNNEKLEQWEKPYYVEENLFKHNGRIWEHLYDHPSGFNLRVFSEDMLDYDYKEKID